MSSNATDGMFAKVLVANRGEIAVRAFRAALRARCPHRRGLPVRGPQLRFTG